MRKSSKRLANMALSDAYELLISEQIVYTNTQASNIGLDWTFELVSKMKKHFFKGECQCQLTKSECS